jgi:hypothetical protein
VSTEDEVTVTISADLSAFREAMAAVRRESLRTAELREACAEAARELYQRAELGPLIPGETWADPTHDVVADLQMWATLYGSPIRQHPRRIDAPLFPGESRIDATERVLFSCSYGADTSAFDSRPDSCWRCDAKQAETDVGLCTPCHGDLRTP